MSGVCKAFANKKSQVDSWLSGRGVGHQPPPFQPATRVESGARTANCALSLSLSLDSHERHTYFLPLLSITLFDSAFAAPFSHPSLLPLRVIRLPIALRSPSSVESPTAPNQARQPIHYATTRSLIPACASVSVPGASLRCHASFCGAPCEIAVIAGKYLFSPLANALNFPFPTLTNSTHRESSFTDKPVITPPDPIPDLSTASPGRPIHPTHHLLRPQCRTYTWHSCRHRLWFRRRFPTPFVAYIHRC